MRPRPPSFVLHACLQVESQMSEHASKLAQLRALEDALLPLWLSRRLEASQAWALTQWAAARDSEAGRKLLEQAQPHWEQALAASKPAREAAVVYAAKAQVRAACAARQLAALHPRRLLHTACTVR